MKTLATLILVVLVVVEPSFAQRPALPVDTTMEAMVPSQRRAYPDVPDEFWDAFLARARQRIPQMKSDLRNLVTAEEAFFADSVKYTPTIGVGGLDYHPSPDNKILELHLTQDGWVATMGNARTKTVCAIFVGSTPLAPAVEEGRPACQVR